MGLGLYSAPGNAMVQNGGTTAFSATPLPTTGTWRRSEIVNVANAVRCGLRLAYTPNRSGSRFHALVLVSDADTVPGINDDSWYAPAVTDGTLTATTIKTAPTGADWKHLPQWGAALVYPAAFVSKTATATSQALRMSLSVDVTDARWLHVAACEKGTPTNPGTLGIRWNLTG